ncbi:MAG: MFS transporter [Alphaproteobacteria bacterium]|nr:MFS transporter [Alphaproteobacteria bacterium]
MPRELNSLFLSIFLFAIAIGIDVVAFPTILTINHIDPARIGLASSFEVIGGIFASFFLSNLVARFGMIRALGFSAYVYALGILLIYFYQSFFLWVVFAFFMGCCWFIYVISRQAWLNILLTDEQRGIATGIFSMVLSAGLAVGPIIVSKLGAANYISFITSAILVLCSYFCLLPLKRLPQPEIESKRIPLKEFFERNPRCFVARFFLDFQTYLLLSFTVVFGIHIGLSYEAAGLLITSYMASGFFDVWVGFVLKKLSPYNVINIGFLGCIFSFLIIILYSKSYIILVVLYFIFGMSISCIYVSVFKIANDDYSKEKLVSANATFQIIGSIGSLFGVLTGGVLLNIFGANGFPIAMILSCVFYLTFLVNYEKKYSSRS